MELLDPKIKNALLLGNEAVIRGALEAGLSFATTYPGTPASEIGDTFAKIAKEAGIYFEYSTNEKVALEAAAGAAFSGLLAMVSMKHYGLNVALDSLLPLVYLECPLVVVVADDPGSWSSIQAEQDSRWVSYLGQIPTLEPADAQEAKEMTKLAFELAQKYKIPILVRLTTRVCHTRSLVEFGRIIPPQKQGKFIKKEFTVGTGPTIARHQKLIDKIKQIKEEIAEKTELNFSSNETEKLGLVASGVSYHYLKEILTEMNLSISILKIGFSYPLPEKRIANFIKNLKEVLVAEEIDPILENAIKRIAKDTNPQLKIYGKDLLPLFGEMKPEYVLSALSKILNKAMPKDLAEQQKEFEAIKIEKRSPTLCPGCPHRATFWAVKKVFGKKVTIGGDIGCYLLAAVPPFNLVDYIVAMGAGIGVSHGVSKATGEKPIILIGDSTFFHAGIPALINLVYNKSDALLIILDNRITAMTGHQPHPGVGLTGTGEETKALKIEEIVQVCGADKIEIANVYNFKETMDKLKAAYQTKGVSVVVAKGECRLLTVRKMARAGVRTPKFEIIQQSPDLEILKDFGCPAIRKAEEGKYYIDENTCWGCAFCSQIFPNYIKAKLTKNK